MLTTTHETVAPTVQDSINPIDSLVAQGGVSVATILALTFFIGALAQLLKAAK
jgi:hypothetical protein